MSDVLDATISLPQLPKRRSHKKRKLEDEAQQQQQQRQQQQELGGAPPAKRVALPKAPPPPPPPPSMQPIVKQDDEEMDRASALAGLNSDPREDAAVKKQRSKKTQELVSQFTPVQIDRYEAFRQSKFPRATVKKTMQKMQCGNINDTCTLIMSGIAKVFVGEVVELARQVEEEWGGTGPLQPGHIREAHRRLQSAGQLPYMRTDVLKHHRRKRF